MENTPAVAEYVAKQENEKAADYRNSSGGNLLFRPIALTEFLSAALKLYKEEEQSFDPVFRKLSRVPLIISEEPWRGLLWDGARIINRASRPLICICQAKVDSEKEQLGKAQFGLVLNWAFVTQGGVPPPVVEVKDILIQESRNVLSVVKIEVQIEFFFHPTV